MTVGHEPFDRLSDPVPQIATSLKTKEFVSARDVQTATRLAVWLCLVPNKIPAITHLFSNCGRQIANADFFSGTQVDRICAIIMLDRKYQPFGGIFDK